MQMHINPVISDLTLTVSFTVSLGQELTHANIPLDIVMNQVGNSKFPPRGHLIFFSTNIRNENKTREIQKWPRARDRT
jgi:hypothetical protein